MKQFDISKIANEASAGELLKEVRIRRKIDIRKASKDLGIKREYLLAIESDDWDSLPQGLYTKTFIREYAIYLGIEPNDPLAYYQRSITSFTEKDKVTEIFSHKKIKKVNLLVFPSIVRYLGLSLIIVAAFIYFGFYIRNYRSAPFLDIAEPEDNMIVNTSFVNVIGVSDPGAQVSVNDEQVLPSVDGSFSLRVNLKSGVNLIRITAVKHEGNEAVVERRVLLK